jgi:hypothetical protein
MNAGVYRITIGKYFYYGSSVNLARRRSAHKLALARGTHNNRRMQRAFDKFGLFSFDAVERVADKVTMLHVEQRHIDGHAGDRLCMNLAANAFSSFGSYQHRQRTAQRNRERVWTAEMRQKLSDSRRGQRWTPRNRDFSGSANPNARLREADILSLLARRRAGELVADLASEYGVHASTLTRLFKRYDCRVGQPKRWTAKQRESVLRGRRNNPQWCVRELKGDKNGRARIRAADIPEIRRLIAAEAPLVQIAALYGVRPETIGAIKSGRNWGWLA